MSDSARNPFSLPDDMLKNLENAGSTLEASKAAIAALKALGVDVKALEEQADAMDRSRQILLSAFGKGKK